jgi:hypothetical protein
MPSRRTTNKKSTDLIIRAAVIATVSATVLVAFAAQQTPPGDRGARRPRLSRAQLNAAEERAVWTEPKAASSSSEPTMTLTGCIEKHGDGFRLTDASGDDAPRARSWKSGFFRKGTVPLDLVDGAQTMPARHVGERVRVTGRLDDRELTLRSLRRIADSCS